MSKNEQRTRAREANATAVRDPGHTVLGQIAPRKRKRWSRLTDAEREQIVALLAITENRREIARRVGVHPETVRRVESELDEVGQLQEMRAQRRGEFVNEAWDCIMLGVRAVKDGLVKGYVAEAQRPDGTSVSMVTQTGPADAARAVLALIKMVDLAEEEPTSIVEELAQSMTDEELEHEIKRLEKVVESQRGRLN